MVGYFDYSGGISVSIAAVARFESFAAASASLISRVPIAHINGGEITEIAFVLPYGSQTPSWPICTSWRLRNTGSG
jgi:hypothetical protein